MKLTFYAGSQPHFVDHLLPLYLGLPDEHRGGFHSRGRGVKYAIQLGVKVTEGTPQRLPRDSIVVVASHEDYRVVKPRPCVMVNHGAGQTYNGDTTDQLAYRNAAYSGGLDRQRVVLNICPSESDAAINREFYPEAASVAVGAPRLDPWHRGERRHLREDGLIVLSFHKDVHVCPESRWAWPHYQRGLMELVNTGRFNLAGHGHPRAQDRLVPFWRKLGIPFIKDFSDVLDRASLYVCDNSSSLFEAASVGIPTLVLSAPWYRREVHHGLRFWSAIPGLAIDEPEELEAGIEEALKDPLHLHEKRESAVRVAYSGADGQLLTDGKATERAVIALTELASTHGG